MVADPIAVALRVAQALEACGVRYLVGGSLFLMIRRPPRSTLDVDMVVELTEAGVERFVGELRDEFHADIDALQRAVREKSSANLIHFGTSTKVDLFIVGGSPLDESQMDRRQEVPVATDPERRLFVYTPEDILLQKLRWYQLGEGVSDRQWRDILGIIVVQGEALDEAYVRDGAAILEVSDLLERALKEAHRE
jgi:hypothetical protein